MDLGYPASLAPSGRWSESIPVKAPKLIGLPPESVIGLHRNRCPASPGIRKQAAGGGVEVCGELADSLAEGFGFVHGACLSGPSEGMLILLYLMTVFEISPDFFLDGLGAWRTVSARLIPYAQIE